MKKIFILFCSLCSVLILAGTAYLGYLYTHRDFKPEACQHALVRTMAVPVSPPENKEQISQLLSQRFSYLGQGTQMTAFESEDGQYVIKLFNPRLPLKEHWFHNYKKLKHFFTLKWLSSAHFKKEARIKKLFTCYALAFNELREETGLIYVHLNSSTALNQMLHLVDKDGSTSCLNLNNTPFVLQRKAELAGARLARLQNQGDHQGLEASFNALRHLFIARATKGFTDRIQTLDNNYGFIGDKAVQIDFGKAHIDDEVKRNPSKEIARVFTYIATSWPGFLENSH